MQYSFNFDFDLIHCSTIFHQTSLMLHYKRIISVSRLIVSCCVALAIGVSREVATSWRRLGRRLECWIRVACFSGLILSRKSAPSARARPPPAPHVGGGGPHARDPSGGVNYAVGRPHATGPRAGGPLHARTVRCTGVAASGRRGGGAERQSVGGRPARAGAANPGGPGLRATARRPRAARTATPPECPCSCVHRPH